MSDFWLKQVRYIEHCDGFRFKVEERDEGMIQLTYEEWVEEAEEWQAKGDVSVSSDYAPVVGQAIIDAAAEYTNSQSST